MLVFKVGKKEYKVRFTHRQLADGNLLDKILKASEIGNGEKNAISEIIELAADVLLAGLQKYHKEEFGYNTEEEHKDRLGRVYDLLDDFEDESTEENPQNAFTLYEMVQDELGKNGFLSQALHQAKIPEELTKQTEN